MTVEDEAFLGPHACSPTICARARAASSARPSKFAPTRIGRGATVGANATVVCGHASAPTRWSPPARWSRSDVPPHALVAGVPARRVGFVCACGETLPRSLACACGRRYRRAGAGLAPVAPRGARAE